MRVLRVATVVTRFEAGAGVVALRGARSLDPDRYQVSIIAGSGDRLLEEAADAGLDVIVEPSLRAPISPRDDLRALGRLTEVIGREGYDLVHTHSAKAGAIGRLAAHRAGVPRIVHTFHGFPFHEFQSAARRSAYVHIERRLGRFTDVALCVGTNVAVEAIRRRLVAPERIRTIGVTVDVTAPVRTPASTARARAALGLPVGVPVVGAVGRLAYQKAPEDFVAAMVALNRPGVRGVWIGGGELAEKVRRLAEKATAGVTFVGERANVPELLPAFDVFALPSRYEGLPVAIVEAMVCGIPVVATAVNAVSDVVVPGETGLLVRPEDPRQLAAALAYLLDNPAAAARMAGAAKARLGERHTGHSLADVLVEAYAAGRSRVHSIKEPTCA
ncbi:glycosyltransferase [Fodinicola acaciae]|uniref:glycosyltransferase n=1 Tax=Fodinicola acaciae TaxID=2681555 RepID=UPI0013D425B5|nr:glycosyltransferase [Fodinicola acaciae]